MAFVFGEVEEPIGLSQFDQRASLAQDADKLKLVDGPETQGFRDGDIATTSSSPPIFEIPTLIGWVFLLAAPVLARFRMNASRAERGRGWLASSQRLIW